MESPDEVAEAIRDWRVGHPRRGLAHAGTVAPARAGPARGLDISVAPIGRSRNRTPMKAAICNRNRRRHRRPARRVDDGGHPDPLVHQHPRDADRVPGDVRRDPGGDQHGRHEGHPGPLQEGLQRREAGPRRRSSSCSSASPSARAARACWRSTSEVSEHRGRRSPRRACSSSSTAPTPTSCARSSRTRSTAWRAPPRTARSRSRRPAASPRRSGIIGTVIGPRPRAPEPRPARRRSARRSPARSSRRCTASPPRTSSSCRVGNKLKRLSAEEAELPHDDARGHPLDPGRRQPARGGRQAALVHPAAGARGATTSPTRAARPQRRAELAAA